jgi:hypothetical protein
MRTGQKVARSMLAASDTAKTRSRHSSAKVLAAAKICLVEEADSQLSF